MKYKTSELGTILLGGIVLTFLILWIQSIHKSILELRDIQEIDMTFIKSFKYIYYSFSFMRPIVAILALVGLFIRKVAGWILLTGFYSYLICETIFLTIPMNSLGILAYSEVIVFMFPLLLANISKIRNQFNVNHYWILSANLATICYGLFAALVQGYLEVYRGNEYWEIIDKLK